METAKTKLEAVRKEPTPLELAKSWLDFRNLEVQREIHQKEASRHFTENYEMKPPGPRPSYIEPGSLDASDWDIAEAEYNQWPEEQEEELNYLEDELQRLDDELDTIEDYRDRLKEGDTNLINELAEKERERRAELEKKRKETEERERLAKEKSAGKEMVGVSETESLLQKIIKVGSNAPGGEKGKNGWELKRVWKYKHAYTKNDSQVDISLVFSPEEGASVDISTFREPITPYERRVKGQVDVGISVGFTLRDGKVYDWNKGRVERDYRWGYPEVRSFPGEIFEQSDFDNARKVLLELHSDLESLAAR